MDNETDNSILELNREQLASFLLISKDTLKRRIKDDTIGDLIVKAGYELIEIVKQGRSYIYKLKKIRDITDWDIIQYTNRIRKINEHDLYSSKRIEEGLQHTKTKIIKDNEINISLTTAKRYDDILQTEGYMVLDKTVYMMYDSETRAYKEITENAYKDYWLRNRYAREQLSNIKHKRKKYLITENDYDSLRDIIVSDIGNKEGTIVVKFDTYTALEKSKELVNIINKTRLARGDKEIE